MFDDVLRGIYAGANDTPYQIQIGNTRYSEEEEERLVRLFIGQGPAALIVTGIDQTKTTRTLLEKANCPIVQIMEISDDPVHLMVGFDHGAAAKEMTRHLVEQGYKKIASVSARMDPRVQRRLQGYRQELRKQGLYDANLEISTTEPSSVTVGRELTQELLQKHPQIDAVFCNNDDLALGCLFACQAAGLRVPEDIGITGFNDLEYMKASHPPLSSITTHRYKMGNHAVELAIQTTEKRQKGPTTINLGYDLAIRKSTSRPQE